MGIVAAVGTFLKIIFFFLNLWSEKDEAKAAKKTQIGKEIVHALAQTNKEVRASRLNNVVGRIDRV